MHTHTHAVSKDEGDWVQGGSAFVGRLGTQFTCFTSTKVQMMIPSGGLRVCGPLSRQQFGYTVYLLYQYKSTNTDTICGPLR